MMLKLKKGAKRIILNTWVKREYENGWIWQIPIKVLRCGNVSAAKRTGAVARPRLRSAAAGLPGRGHSCNQAMTTAGDITFKSDLPCNASFSERFRDNQPAGARHFWSKLLKMIYYELPTELISRSCEVQQVIHQLECHSCSEVFAVFIYF